MTKSELRAIRKQAGRMLTEQEARAFIAGDWPPKPKPKRTRTRRNYSRSRNASRAEQHSRLIDCGYQNWDDRGD